MHSSFVSGMGVAFVVAAVVALAAAGLGLLTRRGVNETGPSVHI